MIDKLQVEQFELPASTDDMRSLVRARRVVAAGISTLITILIHIKVVDFFVCGERLFVARKAVSTKAPARILF